MRYLKRLSDLVLYNFYRFVYSYKFASVEWVLFGECFYVCEYEYKRGDMRRARNEIVCARMFAAGSKKMNDFVDLFLRVKIDDEEFKKSLEGLTRLDWGGVYYETVK